jgi:lipopolysaccharide/colanic/teichoic acid biosynthesis glycosyltransferase
MHTESFPRLPLSPEGNRVSLSRWKRVVDLAGCIAAVPLLGAVTLIAAVIMAFTSPGPLIFQQPVIGNNGRRFGLYRIRTMHVRCSKTKRGSERPPYFLGGRWLQTSGLSNLPQIINIWRGEMSMIGPRPKASLPKEVTAS